MDSYTVLDPEKGREERGSAGDHISTGTTQAGRRGGAVAGNVYQGFAVVLCLVLAVLMILNTQMSGEAMWFWYATLFRHGTRLYSELHIALQPLFVLEMAAWTGLFGSRILVYEVPSLLHAFVLSLGLWLLLRESDWPGWQKAILLFGGFVFTVLGHSYRFDDYHVVAEFLIVYALWLLLLLGRPGGVGTERREMALVAALGVVCGLTFVTRVTDGAALVVAAGVSLPFVTQRKRALHWLLFAAAAAGTVLLVVKLTGDSVGAYLTSSLFKAAGSKGGTGSIFAAPFWGFVNALGFLRGLKQFGLCLVLVVAVAWALARYRPWAVRFVIPLQLGVAALIFAVSSHRMKGLYTWGLFYEFVVLLSTTVMYAVLAVVIVRFVRHQQGKGTWDRRELLVLLPVLEWASYSAGAAGEPITNYYAPVVLLLLLIPILQPFRRYAVWGNPSLVSVFILIAFWGLFVKVRMPYSWQNYKYGSMFQQRTWYDHPVYGDMYIDRDLLAFSQRVCADIGAVPGQPGPALLSLPYPYPNYFCNTPPWHNYVQTFFDTAPRATVEHMMQELATDPPPWIIYQRQLNIMVGSERLYNHGQPLAQRDLDRMIMGKIGSGQWQLVDESSYLHPGWWENRKDTDWYIIRTRPAR